MIKTNQNINIRKSKNQENKNMNKKSSGEIINNTRKNNHMPNKDIEELKEQKRNLSKKAKKVLENKSKKKEDKKIISQDNNNKDTSLKTNINKINNNDINKIENFLKNKAKLSLGGKNFLGSSINYILMDEFKKDDLKPKTEIKKKSNKINIDNIIIEETPKEKEENIEHDKPKLNLNNIFIPMTNKTKENNCFLNVLIQVLFHLESFKKYILHYFDKYFSNIKDEVVFEFCNLINSYNSEQTKIELSQKTKEPILSVNLLRNKLNQKYGNYFKGECGDPIESLEHIFNSIHDEFKSKQKLSKKKPGSFDCPIHKYFNLELIEIHFCRNCKNNIKHPYNKDCYMFQIFVSEISKRITEKNLNFENIHWKFFNQIKEQNEKYDIYSTRIEGCKCDRINNLRKLNLLKADNKYVIINLTWSDNFPDLKDILNIFTSLPLVDKNNHLFSIIEEKYKKKLYIKSLILYGIYHYICVIYLNQFKKWGIIDDKTIKYIDKYYDLVDYLLRNHLSPVGIIYSYDECDKIDDIDIKLNILNKDKYLQILKFCKDVDNSKNIKMSFINKSKESLNEINENYLDNNLFYNSFIHQVINSSSSSNYDEDKDKDDNKLKKSSLNKKSSEEENEKNSINSINNININKVDMRLKKEGKNIKSSVLFLDD